MIVIGRWLSIACRWVLKHPEVVRVVADAVTAHNEKQKGQS